MDTLAQVLPHDYRECRRVNESAQGRSSMEVVTALLATEGPVLWICSLDLPSTCDSRFRVFPSLAAYIIEWVR